MILFDMIALTMHPTGRKLPLPPSNDIYTLKTLLTNLKADMIVYNENIRNKIGNNQL